MSAGIMRGVDRGIVGNKEIFGGTWHGFEEYKVVEGLVPMVDAMKCLDYEVVAVPTILNVTDPELAAKLPNANGKATNQFALVRTDTGSYVSNKSVSDEYVVYQNVTFLKRIEESVFAANPGMGVESCGTLFGGSVAFVNILIDRYRVKKDDSETATRLMFFNGFNGLSITSGAHDTRIVCDNTRRLAEAQAKAASLLQKFRHSSGAADAVAEYMIELADLMKIIREKRPILDRMSEISMSSSDVTNFLGNLFPIAKAVGKATVTTRKNKRDAVLELFETASDLQGSIARTRYAMLQAVTAYSQHSTVSKGTDAAYAWWDVVTGGKNSVRDGLNQKALKLLAEDEIPAVATLTTGEADPNMN